MGRPFSVSSSMAAWRLRFEAALAVDLDRLDHDLVAHVADLLDPLDPVVGQLGDVHQAVLAGRISTKAPKLMIRTTLPW